MSTQIDGGPAFPTSMELTDGMYLRDYFAAKAMQGMFAADTANSTIGRQSKAAQAYAMADEMLKARLK